MGEFKSWVNTDREILKDVIPLDTPFIIGMESSSICNAKCVYCVHSASDRNTFFQGVMEWELFSKIVDQIKEFPRKVKKIDLTNMGEPLCNPKLPAMIHFVKEANIAENVTFITNGLLLTPEKIDEIIQSGVDCIRISLQGLNAAKYQEICGVKMDFEKFISNLTYLYNNKKQCTIRMKIADVAIKDEKEGIQKLKEIFGNISDSLFVENIIPLFSNVNYDAIHQSIQNHSRYQMGEKQYRSVCARLFYILGVCANGDVTSCCDPTRRIVLGNVYEESLLKIWNGGTRKKLLELMLMKQRDKHPICALCENPNDIIAESDVLDPYAELLLGKIRAIK